MIIYDDASNLDLRDFGILVPLLRSRAAHIHEFIKRVGKEELFYDGDIPKLSKEDLLLAHTDKYVSKLYSHELEECVLRTYECINDDGSFHRYDPKLKTKDFLEFFQRVLRQSGGTLKACQLALQTGWSLFLGGGMHHAMSFHGRGFCLINDLVIALKKLNLESAWIVDVDAHKGDGAAEILYDDPKIKTLSIHMKNSWPLDQGAGPWDTPNDIDIALESGQEHNYVLLLKEGLLELEMTGRPKLVLVVLGSDPYNLDELESAKALQLDCQQMLARDQLIHSFCKERRIPVAYVFGGGYGIHAHEPYINFLKWILS